MLRAFAFCLTLTLLVALPACGGSGGGDDAPADPGAPGTLRALAIEGEAAPDSGGGTFGAFPALPIMDAGGGGWCAFVASIVGGTTTSAVYVVQPDGTPTTVLAFAEGAAVPGTARFVADFAAVWMCDDGTVFALANLTGGMGTEGFALIAVDVAGGATANYRTILVDEQSIAAVVAAGVLSDIDPLSLIKEDDGTLWMLIVDSNGGETHLISIESDGSGIERRASTGDLVSGGDTIVSLDAFGVEATGAYYAFAMTDSSGDRRMIMCEGAITPPVYQQFLRDGDPLPSGVGTVADAYKRGDILVYGNAAALWVCKGTQSGADDIYMDYLQNAATQYVELARVTETAPSTGMGTFSAIDMLNSAPSPAEAVIHGVIGGSSFGISHATFSLESVTPTVLARTTENILGSQGQIPAGYINLRQTTRTYNEIARNGIFGYALAWATGSAVFLGLPAGAPVFSVRYVLAAQGEPAPGGDTFGAFSGGVGIAVATGNVLFRAPLDTAGSGIFRQGP